MVAMSRRTNGLGYYYKPQTYTPPLTVALAASFSHAYGTFLLYPGYGGPLGRLYRVSDGAEIDVYPDAATGHANISSVNAWAGSSGALWCRLYNQIGDGTYLEQTSVTNMPVFDPADGTCDCDEADGVVRFLVRTGLSIAQPYTLLFQGIRTSGSATAQTALNLVAANTPGGIGADGSSNDLWIYKPSTTTTGTPGTFARRNAWQTFGVMSNGANASYYYTNWVEGDWSGTLSTTDSHTVDTLSVGGKSGANSSRWQGRFSTILIAPSALTRENLRLVAQKLNRMQVDFAAIRGGATSFGWSVARSVAGQVGVPLAVLENPNSPYEQVVLRSDWTGFADDVVGEHCDGWGVRTLYNQYSVSGTSHATQTTRSKQPRFNWGGGSNGTLTGFNSMTFDGVDDHLVTSSFTMSALNPLCPLALLKAHASPPAADQWLFAQGLTATDGLGMMVRADSAAEGWQIGDLVLCGDGYQSGQTARWIMTNAQGVMDGTWRSFGGRRGTTDAELFAYSSGGATTMTVRSESNAAMQAVTAALYIGSKDASSGFFKGDLVDLKIGQDSTANSAANGWGNYVAQLGGIGGREFS